jgi:hypothetical protein
MWTKIVCFLNDINPLINLAIAALWGIYVYFTIKTFKEIHRQTELQSEAFLMISCDTGNSVTEKMITKITTENWKSYDKWSEILKTHIPSAVDPVKFISLTFKNKGRSDIVSWSADITANIQPGPYLKNKFNIGGESLKWKLSSEGSKDIIPAGEDVTFAIAKVGVYPQIVWSWAIEYSDMRGKRYLSFVGDKSIITTNSLAYSMKEDKA